MKLELDQISDLISDPSLPALSDYLSVTDHGCRWPGEAEGSCCGRAKARGSYCEAHAAIAYRRQQSEYSREVHGEVFARMIRKQRCGKAVLANSFTAEDLGL